MSEKSRSFFSTIPGLVTGLAGLLTGIVGLVTVLIQLGVVGGDDGKDTAATTTTVVAPASGGSTGAGGGGGATATTEVARLTVTPTSLDFKAADPREKTVTVKNVSDTASLTLSPPRITGDDPGQFTVSSAACVGLRAGESCPVRVTFAPAGALRTYKATLQLGAVGGRVEEVRLTASTLLG